MNETVKLPVDVTNYLTFDQGRPLHVFDAAKVKGNLTVRRARDGETVLALDTREYKLNRNNVVIADEDGVESIGGIMGLPAVSAYVSSKFGVTGLTKSAAIELGGANIRVNSVHPGSVDTPMIRSEGMSVDDFAPFYEKLPIKRLGTVDDVTNMVTFLASDESSYVTGAAFVVDGGASCGDPGFIPE